MVRSIMYRKSRKGQFALEFMMTYGWAILVVLTIISALIYFTPNIKTITSKRCTFGPATPCLGTQLTNSELNIVVRNAILQKMYEVSAEATFPETVTCSVIDSAGNTLTPADNTINTDERFTINCPNDPVPAGLGLTDDSSVRVTITYKKSRGGFNQVSEGDIYAKMQR